jgi:hypothetical protein
MQTGLRMIGRRWLVAILAIVLCAAGETARSAPRRPKPKPPPAIKNLPELKTPEDKLRFLEMIRQTFPAIRSTSVSFRPDDLDKMLERYVSEGTTTEFAPLVDDETFLRRVSLDLSGTVPTAAEVKAFVADGDPKKRARVVDELLAGDAYARKWARYWRSVIFYESDANRNSVNPQALEDWLFEQFRDGAPWDRIVAELVSASPQRVKDKKPQENGWQQDDGRNNFILACERKPEIIASQTARIFMGISIGCAECHDHPFDDWEREQFHELAAFFAPGKYYMTDQEDPAQKTEMQARFLLGEEPPLGLKPDQRRVALAAYLIYNPDNYWFARAHVNRVWNELMGDGFYSVDSLGPDKEVVHQLVVNRIAASFRHTGFDMRWLFRMIANSHAYQREIRTISSDSDLFTAVRPARLRPYEVADSVERLIGENKGLTKAINDTFDQNPSVPQRDLEGSVQQALLLMNNAALHDRLSKGPLKTELMAIKGDRELVREAFLAVLARTPTDDETARYVSYLKDVGNKDEAVDDIVWVLVNSAEFVTKR